MTFSSPVGRRGGLHAPPPLCCLWGQVVLKVCGLKLYMNLPLSDRCHAMGGHTPLSEMYNHSYLALIHF